MIRCVVRAAVDLARRRQRLRLTPSDDVDALLERSRPADESAAEGALMLLDRAMVADAVGELPPGPRQLLALRYEAGLSVAHIAVALGRPPGTVRRQCVEARHLAGQRFLARHLRPAIGVCARMSNVICQEPYRLPSLRARRQAVEHLRRCRPCRDRKAEVAALLRELGYDRRFETAGGS
jgi:predicted RNA polymerase sigma factor